MADPTGYTGYQGYPGYGDPGSFSGSEGRRRIIAALLAKQRKYPTTIGEGIASVGENIGNVLYLNSLAEEDRGRATYETNLGRGAPGIPVQGASQAGRATGAAVQPDIPAREIINAPYIARGAAPGEIPLPPPRPGIDSSKMAGEFDANQGLADIAARMVNSENPAQGITQMETVRNRALARGTTVAHELLTRGQNPNAYYPPFAKGPGDVEAFRRNVLTPVLRGSDVGGQQLGFSPTGNASDEPGNPFASRNLDAGRYNIAGHIPGNTEMYVQQETPDQLARLAAARVPGRNSIASAMMPAPDAPPPSPVQTASTAPTGEAASDTLEGRFGPFSYSNPPANPPVTQLQSLMGGGAATPAAAVAPAAPYRNPVTPTDIKPLPQTAQAPATLPSQEPVPAAAPPYVNQLKRPEPLGISPEEAKANAILSNPRIDPNGSLARQMQQVKLYYEGARKEKEAQQQAEYVKAEQRAYEQPGKDLEERYKRGQIELQNATTPTARAKAEADLEQVQAEIVLKRQQAVKPVTETVEGKVYERPPGSPAGTAFTRAPGIEEPDKLTERQQAMLQYFQSATVTAKQLRQIGNADEALSSLPSSIYNRVPVAGNYAVPDRWRGAKNAADSWLLAHVRNQSGAVIGRDEIPQYYHLYFAIPGDDKAEMANKQERRDYLTKGIYNALGGGAAKTAADKFLDEFKVKEETGYPEGTTRTSKSTGKQQILRGGTWKDM
jgi:hypothetical protein